MGVFLIQQAAINQIDQSEVAGHVFACWAYTIVYFNYFAVISLLYDRGKIKTDNYSDYLFHFYTIFLLLFRFILYSVAFYSTFVTN